MRGGGTEPGEPQPGTDGSPAPGGHPGAPPPSQRHTQSDSGSDPLPGQGTNPQAGPGDQGPAERIVEGRYVLQRELGRGGMGVVWEAWDNRLERQVAVKELLLRNAMNAQTQARLAERARREARAIARIGHQHVVAVHDVLEAEGQVWIVMELVPPRSLADVLRERGRLPVPEAAHVGLEVLRGLRAVHEADVLHRDVKPHNVLFRRDGQTVLMDFGVATFEGAAQVTRTHEAVGTPGYLAPELAEPMRGQPVTGPTPAADLWALGVTLYEMTEGTPPFEGDTPVEVLAAVIDAEPPPMRYAGQLQPLIEGLLQKDPQRRTTGADAEWQLAQLAQQSPIPGQSGPTPAPPPAPAAPAGAGQQLTPPAAGSHPTRRRWRWAVPATVLALAVVAGGGWLVWDLARPAAAGKGTPNPGSSGPRGKPAPDSREASTYARATMRNVSTGMCADLPGAGPGRDQGPVNQFRCNPNQDQDNQQWNIDVVQPKQQGKGGKNLVTIKNDWDHLCMDLPGDGFRPQGTLVREAVCNPKPETDNQQWWLETRKDGTKVIHNVAADNLCLGVEDRRSHQQQATLGVFNCDAASNFRWRIKE